MAQYQLTEITAEEFDKFASKHELGSMFQDSRWAKVKSDNWRAKFVALKSKGTIQVASLILIRQLPLGFRMWYLPRGPLFNVKNEEYLKVFSQELKQLARSERCLLIKADPNIVVNSTTFAKAREIANEPRDTKLISTFQSAGWMHFGFNKAMSDTIQPRFNAVFYIENDWEKKIAKKTRKFIRRGEEMGIKVEAIDLDRIDDFTNLIQATAKAKNISLRDRTYFYKIKQTFGDNCLLALTTFDPKEYQKIATRKLQQIDDKIAQTDAGSRTILNQLTSQKQGTERTKAEADSIAKKHKDTIHLNASLSILSHGQLEMLYSGMDRDFDKFYAPHIADKWRIAWAEKRGAKTANFGGIDGSLSDSLSKFKAVFGSNVDEFVGEFNLYTYPLISHAFDKFLPGIKKLVLKIKRR